MDARIPFMLSNNSASAGDQSSNEPSANANSGWSIARMLGVEDCCRPVMFPSQQPEAPVTSSSKSADVPAQLSVDSKPAPTTTETSKTTGGFFSGLAKSMTDALAQRTAAAESQKRAAALETHLKLLKGGALMTRHLVGEASKPIWVSLVIEEDNTAAQIEWRSPQLILNRPVGKQSVALDEVRSVRPISEADNSLLPKGGADCKRESCFLIITDKIKVVFEASTKDESAAWVTAIQVEGMQEASTLLVPTLNANLDKKLQDERRQKELQERRESREARRAEYATGGMSHTARIMAGIKT